MRYLIISVILCFFVWPLSAQTKAPKNIIILISDGGGYNQMLVTDFFLGGKAGMAPFDTFKVKLAMSTYPAVRFEGGACSYDPVDFWSDFAYAKRGYTESAAAASAMATGVKTRNGRISCDIQGHPLTSVSEAAKAKGKAVGVISSVQFAHATPAGFLVHNAWRSNYREIARDIFFSSQADVVMGAGSPFFDDNGTPLQRANYRFVGSQSIWEYLSSPGTISLPDSAVSYQPQDINGDGIADPWSLILSRSELQMLCQGKNLPNRVLAIAPVTSTLSQRRDSVDLLPYTSSINPAVFTLGEMSLASLNILGRDEQGFFLMVEGGAIDWANHGNEMGSMIEEMAAFYAMADTVIRWVNEHSSWDETLLIVTSDHECGYIWGPGSGDSTFVPIGNQGKGNMPQAVYYSDDHSNSLVPFFAYGCGAETFMQLADETDSVRGAYITNSEIAQQIKQWWGNPATLSPAMVNGKWDQSQCIIATAPYAGATYQWYCDGKVMKGEDDFSLCIVPAKLPLNAKIFCRLSIGQLQYDTPFLVIQP